MKLPTYLLSILVSFFFLGGCSTTRYYEVHKIHRLPVKTSKKKLKGKKGSRVLIYSLYTYEEIRRKVIRESRGGYFRLLNRREKWNFRRAESISQRLLIDVGFKIFPPSLAMNKAFEGEIKKKLIKKSEGDKLYFLPLALTLARSLEAESVFLIKGIDIGYGRVPLLDFSVLETLYQVYPAQAILEVAFVDVKSGEILWTGQCRSHAMNLLEDTVRWKVVDGGPSPGWKMVPTLPEYFAVLDSRRRIQDKRGPRDRHLRNQLMEVGLEALWEELREALED